MSDNRLIVALDFPDMEQAKSCVEELGDAVGCYKVGMELYYSAGNQIITFLKAAGKFVFLDLKLQDIPNTVAHAMTVLSGLGADMLNVHAVGGEKMMAEAAAAVRKAAAGSGGKAPKLIAVTILTSMDEEQYGSLNYKTAIAEQVLHLAKLAQRAGLDGVVASPQEAAAIRAACGENFLIVTPGVRPAGVSLDDQNRVATPEGALRNGATHIVVGRPITKAADRKAAAVNIAEAIKEV
ncbi:MAG: orotidine-5'-phosphate decarboxylase [Acidaminococcaceae bacterium]|nr:orotidine-5'-phosphate decarboxylase [Acidaminococcaceae bacterium]